MSVQPGEHSLNDGPSEASTAQVQTQMDDSSPDTPAGEGSSTASNVTRGSTQCWEELTIVVKPDVDGSQPTPPNPLLSGEYTDQHEEDQPSALLRPADEAMSSWCSLPFFTFTIPFFRLALELGTELKASDVPACPTSDDQQEAADRLREILTRHDSGRAVYIALVGPLIGGSMFGMLFATVLMFATPMANQKIVELLEDYHSGNEMSDVDGYMWALIAGGIGIVFSGLMQQAVMAGAHAARRSYASLTTLIFEQPALLTSSALSSLSEGEIINMMSVDCNTVLSVTLFIGFAGFGLITMLVASTLLVMELGVVSLPAIALLLLTSFANKWIGDKAQSHMSEKNKRSGERIVRLNEALQGIRSLKSYGWEEHVSNKVDETRQSEVDSLTVISWWNALSLFLMAAVPRLAVCGTLLLYVAEHGQITAGRAFYVASIFDFLNIGALVLPMLIVQWGQVVDSMDRILKLLSIAKDFVQPQIDRVPAGQVSVLNADFCWGAAHEPAIQELTMQIKPGSLVAIVGEVASGKTTLATGLLSLLTCSNGTVKIGGSTALVAQQPFVMNDTVRNNIVFHDTFDEERYDRAVDACALKPDFKAFVNGDQTEVGEKGVTISGGQKQRVALARAAYSDADVLVMDDPLSAMDAHVGMQIFENCFQGLMAAKTRIFCTNQLQYVDKCDYVYVLQKGVLVEQGTHTELLQKTDGKLQQMMKHQTGSNRESSSALNIEDDRDVTSVDGSETKASVACAVPASEIEATPTKKLMQAEKKTAERPSPLFLGVLAKAANSSCLFVLVMIVFFGTPAIEFVQNLYLAKWVDNGTNGMSSDAVVYVIAAGVFTLVTAFSAPICFVFLLRCATHLHVSMLGAVLDQSMGWFDTTPVGRILNVFSGDMMQLDIMLPRFFQHFQLTAGPLLITIIPAIILIPQVMLPMALLLTALCYAVYRYAGNVMVECQRLYNMSQGPVLTSFSAYLQGLDTIRAFGRVDAFSCQFRGSISSFMNISFWQAAVDRCAQGILGGPLVSIFFLIPLGIALIYFKVDSGMAALLLYYGSSFALRLPGACFTTMMMERGFVAAQRLIDYSELPPEPILAEYSASVASSCWKPTKGSIEFSNVSMRYAQHLPTVLNRVSVKIEPGTKVGVVGRTGAGKSSLVLAIFRMMQLEAGSAIEIDGQNISDVPVRALRRSLGLIPQDTFMFSGTIRSNLCVDVEDADDDQLWSALEKVNLRTVVESLENQLAHKVEEKGSNLSAGTVQLVCLARVLLKNPQVIFMDEATSSVDLATDTLVQQTIRKAFSHATIVTIAHRLNTVIDFDKILVLDNGSVVEYDTPCNLLKIKSGHFSRLVNSTGAESAAELWHRANAKYSFPTGSTKAIEFDSLS
jgi:ABC-type multidrug transport system fused ATPase/permease subunit